MKQFVEKAPDSDSDNVRAEMERDSEMHFSNLYDENETQSGEQIDLATGKPIDNSTDTGMEGLSVREVNDTSEDALGSSDDENDEAAHWLREHE